MIEAILIGALLALLVAQRWDHGRQAKQNALTHSEQLKAALAHVRELTNQIVQLKVDPRLAAAYSAPEPSPEDELRNLVADDSPAADEAWAEMVERNRS